MNSDDLLKYSQPIIFTSNVLFPQVLLVLLYELFTDKSGKLSDDKLKKSLPEIENYIDKNPEDINQHFEKPAILAWNNPEYLLKSVRNKGTYKTKNGVYNEKKDVNFELTVSQCRVSFEEITGRLISAKPRWRYSTIIEENTVADSILHCAYLTDPPLRHKTVCTDENEPLISLIHYTSNEYSIKLCSALFQNLKLNNLELEEKLIEFEPFNNPFALFDI